MFRIILSQLILISLIACENSKKSDGGSAAFLGEPSNFELTSTTGNTLSYKFLEASGTYDIVIISSAMPSTDSTYSSLDTGIIQGTYISYNKLSLKPLQGIFIPQGAGYAATALPNSIIPMDGAYCAPLAMGVTLNANSVLDLNLGLTLKADQIVSLHAIEHVGSNNPCDPSTALASYPSTPSTPSAGTVSFQTQILPPIVASCSRCHTSFVNYAGIRATVWAFDHTKSGLYQGITGRMSQYAPAGLAELVKTWVNEGAQNN